MNFKEQLQVAKQHELNLVDLDVAYEVHCLFGEEVNDEEFEWVCAFIKEIYLTTDGFFIPPLTIALYDMYQDGKYENIADLLENVDERDILGKVSSWYE